MNDVRDVIIIGGGPAGYTAALYAARANLEPARDRGLQLGRPADDHERRRELPRLPRRDHGAGDDGRVPRARPSASAPSSSPTTSPASTSPSARSSVWVGDDEYRAQTVIVATGATARQLGLESERALHGRGVTYCATCDGAFFRDKEVVVVGGGDSAMEEALFLTKFASKVTLVHRRDEFRASQIMVDRARANEKIEILTPYVVEEVLGVETARSTGVRLRNARDGRDARLSPPTASSSRSATTRRRSSSSTSSTTTRTAT